MVAGTRLGNAAGARRVAVPSRKIRVRQTALLRRCAASWAVPVALYLLAVVALLSPWPFGGHPGWAYNWEGYTAWRWSTYWEPPVGPTYEIWAPNDGLMTDSGQGLLVGLPVTLGIAIAGFNLDAMRAPVMLLAAAAAPLLWGFARPIAGAGPALLAALLLASSPAFLLYGRTATLVGVSLVPLLLTAIALGRVIAAPPLAGWNWRREGVLAGSLLLGIFAYAPVRLLWPLTIAFLGAMSLRNRPRRRVLVVTALVCAVAVPMTTMALEQFAHAEPEPLRAALEYFHARGEHLVAMRDEPTRAGDYIREPAAESEAVWEPVRLLVIQNSRDLAYLLLDRETRPVLTEFWNEHGRFWPWFLVPFGVLGMLSTLWNGLRGRPALLLPLFLFAGLTAPLLLTSRVHVGRLLPALPFALIFAAIGVWIVATRLVEWSHPFATARTVDVTAALVAAALLVPTVVSARADLRSEVAISRESLTAATLASWHAAAAERGAAVLVEDPTLGDEIEQVHAATYRLELDRLYRFVDLQQRAGHDGDSRPILYWRGALRALEGGEIATPCGRLWFVTPEVAPAFLAAWRDAGCRGAPHSVVLP